MPVAGLILNFTDNQAVIRDTLSRIGVDGNFTIGDPPFPGRVPLVMESEDEESARRQLKWLTQLPGVIDVHVVSVDNSDRDSSLPSETSDHTPVDEKGVTSS